MDLVHQTYKLQTTQSHESNDNLGDKESILIFFMVFRKNLGALQRRGGKNWNVPGGVQDIIIYNL